MINKILKTGIVDSILSWAKAKEEIDLGKTMKGGTGGVLRGKAKRLYIPKLEDANLAGGGQGHECTLILTEGDSAKSLAVAGLSIIGRNRYGVFPLKGILMNMFQHWWPNLYKHPGFLREFVTPIVKVQKGP